MRLTQGYIKTISRQAVENTALAGKSENSERLAKHLENALHHDPQLTELLADVRDARALSVLKANADHFGVLRHFSAI
jgi:hypothetical protein